MPQRLIFINGKSLVYRTKTAQELYSFQGAVSIAVTVRIILSALNCSERNFHRANFQMYFFVYRIMVLTMPEIISTLDLVKHRLSIPIVYNTGGYERTETIDMLNGYVDVYLPDIKYYSSEMSKRYSNAADYFEYASKALTTMIKQVGALQYNSDGGLIKGTIIRHLVLPKGRHDSIKIMEWIAQNTSAEDVLVSIMNQYTPFDFISDEFPELKRRVTKMEYNSVVRRAQELGINGFTQERTSAADKYVPDFDLSGL